MLVKLGRCDIPDLIYEPEISLIVTCVLPAIFKTAGSIRFETLRELFSALNVDSEEDVQDFLRQLRLQEEAERDSEQSGALFWDRRYYDGALHLAI